MDTYKNFISEIPTTAWDLYQILPEGTRCEVMDNELIFPEYPIERSKYKSIFPEIPSSALELFHMLPEGTRCEVIANELIMSPSPTSLHQLILSDLHALIYMHLKKADAGKIIPAPMDVYLDNESAILQPDLIVILKENEGLIKTDGVFGSPDIIIEILSKNRVYDTKRKRSLYEKVGVKEYFMIDPQNKETTLVTLNSSGVYEQSYKATGIITSKLLACSLVF